MRTFFHTCVLIPEMNIFGLILISVLFQFQSYSVASETVKNASTEAVAQPSIEKVKETCVQQLSPFKSYFKKTDLNNSCSRALLLKNCQSVQGTPIFHFDDKSQSKEKSKNILVISLIHGDETQAGALGRYWVERLEKIQPRNNWRIIPVMNPDGVAAKTRMNANGVDLNRNFPTLDWNEKAIDFWKKEGGSSKRRFPGHNAASEPEVGCLLSHIEEYQPDFVMSIHTPLRVLDFDGPHVKPPIYNYLPWKRLGNFPGSLGRYLWVEKSIPVLTTELRNELPETVAPFEQLQDVIGELVQKEIKK